MSNTNANFPTAKPDWMPMEWWAFFLAIFNRTGGAGTTIDINSLQKQDEITQQGVNDLWAEQRGSENLTDIRGRLADIENALQLMPDSSGILRRLDELESMLLQPRADSSSAPLAGANFVGAVAAPKFQTATATVASVASGVATTIYTMPNIAPAAWLVHANFNFTSNDTANYNAFAVIVSDGSAARIALSNNAALMSIGLSGLGIQVTQSSGAAQPVNLTVTRVG